jgi:hypothetical protein
MVPLVWSGVGSGFAWPTVMQVKNESRRRIR